MTSRRCLLLLVFLGLGLVPRRAEAGLSARLVYLRSGAAESCPDSGALRKAVANRLGYDPFLAAAAHTIVAEVSGEHSELRARARLLDENGIVLGGRELVGNANDCAELLASLAIAISLTLDPMMAATAPSPSPMSEEQTNAAAASDVVAEPSAAPEPPAHDTTQPKSAPERHLQESSAPPEHPWNLSLVSGLALAAAVVPKVSPAVTFGASVRHKQFSLELDAMTTLAQEQTARLGASAQVSLDSVAVAPCAWYKILALCALGNFGRYSGKGRGVDAPRFGSHGHVATGLRLRSQLDLSSRWSLLLGLDGVRTWTRPAFIVAGQEVYRPGPWAANLGLFVQWRAF